MERLLPHIVLTTQVTHHQSVRDQDLAGAHRAPDWSRAAPGLVVLQSSPGHYSTTALVRTAHLAVLALGLVLLQPPADQLHCAALGAVPARGWNLLQQSLREVEPCPVPEPSPALRTGAEFGSAGAADDVTLQNVNSQLEPTKPLT